MKTLQISSCLLQCAKNLFEEAKRSFFVLGHEHSERWNSIWPKKNYWLKGRSLRALAKKGWKVRATWLLMKFSLSHFRSQTTKVVISGIPHHANFTDVEPLLKAYGNVEECDAVASKDPKTQTVHITFETYEQAQRWETLGELVVCFEIWSKSSSISKVEWDFNVCFGHF